MTCASCGTLNADGAKFCSECGEPLSQACPTCGSPVAADAKFCSECGQALVAPATTRAEATAAGPPAERRLVTVLFADLVGFTSLSEGRDAEETRELLSRYFDTCRRLIELYGGTVEKFIGDAVMAVWGTPVATEDDAERAVRAALDLVAAVTSLGDEVGATGLRARAGVLTGEAAVTVGATGEGMVAGDLVNTASRIQSVAEPGTVYVGEATRRATEQTIVFAEAGSFELKGKEGLTPLWHALRVVSGARGTLKSTGLEAPFVGRDGELRRIKDLFHTSAEEGRAHLVSVTGIAGIGKSRLAWEFYKYFDGLPQLTYWHRGRCLAYGEGVAYWALADMVRMRCRIAEDDDQDTARAKLHAALEEHVSDPDERAFVEPRLAQLLGLAEAESPDRQDLFAAWRLFFERLAEVYATVLAFEDMQWADESLLDFVEHLLDWSRNHPIYVITLARPELVERRPTWGAGQRNFTSIYLDPLPAHAMGELLDGLVPGLPTEAREQILARAEGVPLYAVETVRMLLDRGDLVQDGPVYRPAREIGTLDVPETLHALIAARLDGLSPEERRLLQDGAVLGKTFTERALVALDGVAEQGVGGLLTGLVRKEVLSLQTDPRSPEHGQYGFLQDLVRHVAYETLSRRERRTRHLAAAAYLEASLVEDEVAEVVAAHYVAALEAVPDTDDAAEIRDRARDALARAGDRATALAASAEAHRYYRRAAELAVEPHDQASLLDRAGQAALRANAPIEARELLERAHALFAADDAQSAALVSVRLGELDWLEGHSSQAAARLEAALDGLAGREPDADVASVAGQLGRFLVLNGDPERALPYVEQALSLAEALDVPEVLSQSLNTKATFAATAGRTNEARILLQGALEVALEHDLHPAALRAYNNLAWVLEMQDRPREVLVVCDRGVEHARRIGDRSLEENFVGGSLYTRYLLGDWDDAQAQAATLAETAATYQTQLLTLDLIAIHAARGELAEARTSWEQLTEEPDDPQAIVVVRVNEAIVLRAEGSARGALASAETAFACREQVGISSMHIKRAVEELLESALAAGDRAKAEEILAILDALRPGELTPLYRGLRGRFRGRLAEGPAAAAHFREAEQAYEALGAPFHLAVTQLEHAESLETRGPSDEAEALRGSARAVFARVGATPWLDRADRAPAAEQVTA